MNFNTPPEGSVNPAYQLEDQFGSITVRDNGTYEYSEVSCESELYTQQVLDGSEAFCYAHEQAAVTLLDSGASSSCSTLSGPWECVSPEVKSLDSLVDQLGPEEVRWFYKCDSDKRWLEFSGYDSLRIEFKYRQLFHEWQYYNEAYSNRENGSTTENYLNESESNLPNAESALYSDPSAEETGAAYKIVVRGGMYEVDLHIWKCSSIYWPGEECVITRGSWFYDGTWQPLDSEQSSALETVHLQYFYGHKLSDYAVDPASKTPKTVLHTESFPEFHVDWYSPGEVYLYSEAAPSKLVRTFTSKLGFHKSTGYRLYRGYKHHATHSDRPVDITHLVFVIHGIGHKIDQGRIIRNTTLFRDCVGWLQQKYFSDSSHRAEFFPVEWRSSLKLDGDIVEAITPQKILGFRTLLNSSAMDIMYYTSPLYGSEVQRGLSAELNRLYAMFTQRNPYFAANGGKVSVIAHSLGCVIVYDIVTGWRPDYWRQDTPPPPPSPPPAGPGDGEPKSRLNFKMDNFFCLGSPLSVFLALRWRDPGAAEHDTIIPPSLCRRLYNVFHPTDPVAYRMEPLLLRAYTRIAPLQLQPYNAASHLSYGDIPLELITPDSASAAPTVGVREAETDSPGGTPSRDRGWSLWGLMRGNWKPQDGTFSPQFDQANSGLQHRLDYVLRETSIGVSYLSALTSHTTYWNNYDVAYFVLTRLFPGLEAARQSPGAEAGSGVV